MKKNSSMYSAVLYIWFLVIFYFDLKLLSLLIGPENILAKLSVIIFVLCLNVFWLYGIYHIIVPIFSLFISHAAENVKRPEQNFFPRVAILYATKDDFKESAIMTCLQQDYPNYHLFICDDSTDSEYKEAIDSFVKSKGNVSLIRRKVKKGYKAGNLNYALRLIQNDYLFFAICDSDTVLPKNFVKNLIPHFSSNVKLGFAQAVQASPSIQKTNFSQDLKDNIDIHWKYYVPAKEKYGFTMFYGHGAIIRTSAWKEVNGFSEIATEDLDFSIKLKEAGCIGITDLNTKCYEEFPASYSRYRKRTEKWIRGTAEVLKRNWKTLIFSKNLKWFEKLDILTSAVSLLISTPFLVFIMITGLALPIFYNLFKFGGPLIFTPVFIANNWTSYLLSAKYNVMWTWDLCIIMILMIFGHSFPVVIHFIRKPKKLFHYMSYSTFIYLGSIVSSAINLISYLITKKAPFLITGEKIEDKKDLSQRLTITAELIMGVFLLVLTFKYMNIWLSAIALSLCLTIFVLNKDWYSRTLRFLIHIPFSTTLLIVGLIMFSILKKI